ncbi:MAG: hypothetical protein ABW166_05330 [Sedimenticola sp.]
MKFKEKLPLLLLPLLLAGCGAHPGSGNWRSVAADGEFVRFEVGFDGRAQLYIKGREDAVRRCFWGGVGSDEIQMKCTVADNTDVEISYRFRVIDGGRGELILSNRTIGLFDKEAE